MQIQKATRVIPLKDLNPLLYSETTATIPPSIRDSEFPASPGDPLLPHLTQERSLVGLTMPRHWQITLVAAGKTLEQNIMSTQDAVILKLREEFSISHPFIKREDLDVDADQESRIITSSNETPNERAILSERFPPGSLSTIRHVQAFCLFRLAKVIPEEEISLWSAKHKVCILTSKEETPLEQLVSIARTYNQGRVQNNPIIKACKILRRMHQAVESAKLTKKELEYLKTLASQQSIDLNAAHAILQVIFFKRVSYSYLKRLLKSHKIPLVENGNVNVEQTLMDLIRKQERDMIRLHVQEVRKATDAEDEKFLSSFARLNRAI